MGLRIAILGTRGYPYVYSGYETFVSELAPRLVARGHEVTVYCHRQLFSKRPRKHGGISLVYVPAIETKVLSQFSHSFLSTLHVSLRGHDVAFYVNSANGPFGVIPKLLGTGTAINVDGLEWLRPKWKGLGAAYFRWASSIATRVFDEVITDSDRMAEIYRQEFNASSTVIAYGANEGVSLRPERLSELSLEPEGYYLVVGRLIPDNNGELIVRGFERSKSHRKLVVLGDVPYRDAYAERIRSTKDPRVVFPGYVKDQDLLRELYANAYGYLHGHEYGGTNPSLLLALAYGSCILALDTIFSREVLDDGTYGRFFRKDPLSVADAIDLVDTNPTEVHRLKSMSRERIREKYTWEHITDQYEAVFQRIAAGRHKVEKGS